MVWPRIGDQYHSVIQQALREAPSQRRSHSLRTHDEPALASRMPELCLDHLVRMTDDTGIIQHACFSLPARSTGYCVDDNARALIVAVHADRLHGSAATRKLVTTYLSYMLNSQGPDGRFHNFMTYQRVLETEPASDDCVGRAIWALGVTADIAEDEGCRLLARDMLLRTLRHAHELGPRGTAQAALGIVSMLNADPGASGLRSLLDKLVLKLVQLYRSHARDDWRWFEPSLTYDNAILPLALFAAYGVTADRASLQIAQASLEFLEETCFEGNRLALVGNAGWYARGGSKAVADEQPIDAAACVLAFCCAYKVTNNRHYLRRMRESFAWFLGINRIGEPLYDFSTGGCRDGIGLTHLNQNQGAESTIGFLMALLKILELAGEGLELAPQRSAIPTTAL